MDYTLEEKHNLLMLSTLTNCQAEGTRLVLINRDLKEQIKELQRQVAKYKPFFDAYYK